MRAVEREGWNLDPEAVAARRLHLIAADHDAGRGRQRSAAGILEALTRAEDRLLADNAGAANFLHPSLAVGDLPVAVAQLDRFLASVFDPDVVGPYVTVLGRRRAILEIERLHRDFDRSGSFRVHRQYPLFPSRRYRWPRRHESRPAQCRSGARSRQARRVGASRSRTRSPIGSGEPCGVIGWMQTWSAPASQCCWMRLRIASSSPHATMASRKRSEPPPERSSSSKPWRRHPLT